MKTKTSTKKIALSQKEFVPYQVITMLAKLPADLRSIFVPQNTKEMYELEYSLVHFSAKQNERNLIMKLQKLYNLPFRPNDSMSATIAKARIETIKHKKDKLPRKLETTDDDEDNLAY